MNVEKTKERIEELKSLIFQVEMVDRWGTRENELWDKYTKELRELKDELKVLQEQDEK